MPKRHTCLPESGSRHISQIIATPQFDRVCGMKSLACAGAVILAVRYLHKESAELDARLRDAVDNQTGQTAKKGVGTSTMVSPKPPHNGAHDRDLKHRVTNYLLGYKMPSLRQLQVESDNGTVTIRGKVPSFYQKQLCINCSRRVAGVVRLIDELTVLPPSERQATLV